MLIITGTVRSYTSLTMRILKDMGAYVVGEKFPEGTGELKRFNPDGYYELNKVVFGKCVADYGDSVIKIILSGLYPCKQNMYEGIKPYILRKSNILWLVRPPIEVASSCVNVNPKNILNPFYYYSEVAGFLYWLDKNEWLIKRITLLDTNDFFNNTKQTIKSLADYCHFSLKENKIDEICSTIHSKNKPQEKWPKEFQCMAEKTEELYNLLIDQKINEAIAIIKNRVEREGSL